MKVRVGFGLGTAGSRGGIERFESLVDGLERHGFDSLWLSERITGGAVDPLMGLAVAAGRTTRLKLGTSVLVVPGRNPAVLAKELASLDHLSRGRLLPAVGLGVRDEGEQQAFGVNRKERGAWFDEVVPLLRRFWTGEPVEHHGPRFDYSGITVRPTPVQQPLEMWLGGAAPSELRRVGRLGDGWLPSFTTAAAAAEGRVVVEQAAAEADRSIDPEHWGALVVYHDGPLPDRLKALLAARRPDHDPADVVPSTHAELRVHLQRFVDVGFSKFVLIAAAEPDDWDAELSALAEEVLSMQV
ncbi:MAG: TIGR03619 family F420-dependent LLM class oxidoreductase [Acidimicrobiales bacterium]